MSRHTSVSLGDQFARFIDSEVAGGRYGSASEVVRAGSFRQPAGSHVIVYRQNPDGGIVVVRVLHQGMDPTLHA